MAEPSTTRLLVGLDLGTGRCKAALVRADGTVVHVARRSTPTRRLPAGGASHPVPDLLASIESLLLECASAACGPIAGIGIAGMSEAGVPLGRRGRALGDVMAWFDPRPVAEAAAIAAQVGAERLHAVTGLRADAKYTLAKLLWLGRHRPGTMRRMAAWAGVPELAARHLGGVLATGASLACRTLAFDVARRRWDADLLGLAGLAPERMAPVLPFGSAAGGLRPEVAGRVGLMAGIPVCVAGHDHAVGAFGAGVVRPGQAVDSMGSAEPVMVITDRPRLDDALRTAGMSTGCHVLDDRWYVAAGLQQSGATVDWFVDTMLAGGVAAGSPGGGDSPGGGESPGGAAEGGGAPGGGDYGSFVALLREAPTGPSGVLVLPYLRGRSAPHPDAAATLDVLGVRPGHGLPDLALGILDGTAFATRWMLESLERAAGMRVRRVRLIGGGTRNERWLAIKSAVSPWPVDVAEAEEAVAVGAALAAGIASGLIAGPAAAARLADRARPLERRGATRARYERAYRERFLPAVSAAG